MVFQPLNAIETAAEGEGVLFVQTEAWPEEFLLQTADSFVDNVPGAVAIIWICNTCKEQVYHNKTAEFGGQNEFLLLQRSFDGAERVPDRHFAQGKISKCA